MRGGSKLTAVINCSCSAIEKVEQTAFRESSGRAAINLMHDRKGGKRSKGG